MYTENKETILRHLTVIDESFTSKTGYEIVDGVRREIVSLADCNGRGELSSADNEEILCKMNELLNRYLNG